MFDISRAYRDDRELILDERSQDQFTHEFKFSPLTPCRGSHALVLSEASKRTADASDDVSFVLYAF